MTGVVAHRAADRRTVRRRATVGLLHLRRESRTCLAVPSLYDGARRPASGALAHPLPHPDVHRDSSLWRRPIVHGDLVPEGHHDISPAFQRGVGARLGFASPGGTTEHWAMFRRLWNSIVFFSASSPAINRRAISVSSLRDGDRALDPSGDAPGSCWTIPLERGAADRVSRPEAIRQDWSLAMVAGHHATHGQTPPPTAGPFDRAT